MKLSTIFRRPLYQCDFEICSTTPQLDPNRKPIWFCNCKLRYTIWEIWESKLQDMRVWAILKQLFGSSSFITMSWFETPKSDPSFLPHDQVCEARGVVGFCIGHSLAGQCRGSLAGLASLLATMLLSLLVLLDLLGLLIGWFVCVAW